MIEAGNITIDGGKLKVRDVESESMSRYFEDVSLKEVANASNKALHVVRKRFRNIESNQEPENQLETETESNSKNENSEIESKEEQVEQDEQQNEYQITRNVKIIDGQREDGSLILKEVNVGEE